ncbi:CRISPR-associated helicase Cas3' [Saccharopolyspora gregorii]|uniref:CRISPR-associated helicase/endonuclease Cas3 n=1 Tax=Saccharopolyspora gregorii TaxID=33914 RepID=A0ABP6RQR7_9PSEU
MLDALKISPTAPLWGPWGKAGNADHPHPLICHAIDTAAVAGLLYDVLLGPRVRLDLEEGLRPLGNPRAWVAVLAGLHDIGKCSPIFQAIRHDLAAEHIGEEVRPLVTKLKPSASRNDSKTFHGTLTAVHLSHCLDSWGASVELRDALSFGLGGHHGSLLTSHEVRLARGRLPHHGGEPWFQLRCAVVREVAKLWGLGDPAEADWRNAKLDVPGAVGLAGLTSVADWIASDENNFGYAEPPLEELDLTAYREKSLALADKAVHEKLCWKRWTPPTDTTYRGLFRSDPRPLNEAVEEQLADRDEPGVLVIEAPTGEGKTRAGFQAAATLVNRLGLSGMYFALPTKATAAQVHDELTSVATELQLPYLPNLVQGRSPVTPTCVSEDGDGAHDGHEWFTRKRGLLFPIGVGTIDQALQSVITSRHVFVRLTGLSGKVLVLDEVHDVDAHMTTLLRRLMWWCGRFGIPVALMSATLPAGHREQLIAQWRAGRGGRSPRHAEPGPATSGGQQVTWADEHNAPASEPVKELSRINANRPPVALHHIAEAKLAGWLREQDGCALVVRNLVRDAQATYEALEQEIKSWQRKPELVLLTGHTPTSARAKIERWLRTSFGPTAATRPYAIVIGTQVLQHSLDVDFDVLASDLAPINELIQRLGRVHRHERDEVRSNSAPQFALIQPPEDDDGPKFARGLHNVYHHAPMLQTWRVLWGRSELKLPGETGQLVSEVYDAPDQVLSPAMRRRFERAERSMVAQDSNDESKVRRFYLPPLRPEDSVRELTDRPTIAARTRKDTPWKDST